MKMTEMTEMNQDAESAIMRGGFGKLRDTGLWQIRDTQT